MVHGDPNFAQVGQKMVLEVLATFFSELLDSYLLILIESPNIFHWKSAKKIKVGVALGQNLGQIRSNVVQKVKERVLLIGFFHMLHREYLLKQKAVVVQTAEWKVRQI